MQKWLQSLEDPSKVAAIQKFFGVKYNKRIQLKSVAEDEQQHENISMLPMESNSNITQEKSRSRDRVTPNDVCNNIETGKNSDHDSKKVKNYTVENRFWYYLFLVGTYFGDVAGYAVVIPFWFWNVDVVIGRKLVLVWTVIMYIGQALKEIVCRERPACPPVIRLQKKWSEEYGMPSTHAMVGVAFPSSIIYYSSRRYKFHYEYGIVIALLWCALISFSRLYLGMHSISDVLVGLLLSSLLLIIFVPVADTVGTELVHNNWIIFAIVGLSVILIAIYPKPRGQSITSSRGDTTSILATCSGIQVGCWVNCHLLSLCTSDAQGILPYIITVPTWTNLGHIALRTILGLFCIFSSLFLLDILPKATYWVLYRLKKLSHNENSAKKQIPVVDLFFKYLSFGITSFHVVCSIPGLFNYLGINRSTYYVE